MIKYRKNYLPKWPKLNRFTTQHVNFRTNTVSLKWTASIRVVSCNTNTTVSSFCFLTKVSIEQPVQHPYNKRNLPHRSKAFLCDTSIRSLATYAWSSSSSEDRSG